MIWFEEESQKINVEIIKLQQKGAIQQGTICKN